jgi:hypothetical protein
LYKELDLMLVTSSLVEGNMRYLMLVTSSWLRGTWGSWCWWPAPGWEEHEVPAVGDQLPGW